MVRRRRSEARPSRVIEEYRRSCDWDRAMRLAAKEPDPRAAMAKLYVAIVQGIVPHPSSKPR